VHESQKTGKLEEKERSLATETCKSVLFICFYSRLASYI